MCDSTEELADALLEEDRRKAAAAQTNSTVDVRGPTTTRASGAPITATSATRTGNITDMIDYFYQGCNHCHRYYKFIINQHHY